MIMDDPADGTVLGVQLAAVFQSVPALPFQVKEKVVVVFVVADMQPEPCQLTALSFPW